MSSAAAVLHLLQFLGDTSDVFIVVGLYVLERGHVDRQLLVGLLDFRNQFCMRVGRLGVLIR